MRKLTHDNKLVARTAPEIVSWVNAAVDRSILKDELEFRDRKVSVEAALNAMFLFFLDREEEEQRKILRSYVPAFEAILNEDEPVSSPARLALRQDDPGPAQPTSFGPRLELPPGEAKPGRKANR